MKKTKLIMGYRVILLAFVFVFLLNILLGSFMFRWSRKTLLKISDERMHDIVNVAAGLLDGDKLDRIADEGSDSDEYWELCRTLSVFYEDAILKHICVLRPDEFGSLHMLIDPDAEGFGRQMYAPTAQYANPEEEDAEWQADAPAAQTAKSITENVTDWQADAPAAQTANPVADNVDWQANVPYTENDTYYSAVFNADGEIAGIIEMEFWTDWYKEVTDQNYKISICSTILFFIIEFIVVYLVARYFRRKLKAVSGNLTVLATDIDDLTKGISGDLARESQTLEDEDDIQAIGSRIAALKNSLRSYIGHAETQANNMATALAADYRSVYYVDLDKNDAICYREDKKYLEMTREGVHFNFFERFTWYAENIVDEQDREVFLQFIDPENIRKALESRPTITCRYLARWRGSKYYEMIRMAAVLREEDRQDHIIHAVGMGIVDVDEGMRENMAKNQALADALALSEEANRAKTAFLSNMSHEIRTPMNAIIGLNNLALQDETLTETTREYLEKTGDSARHLLGLINDILDMSRIESGKFVLNKEEFSFAEMLEQINTMVMSQCMEKGLTYECTLRSRVDDYYIGDALKLKQVLINILGNSVKFTNAPGCVSLSVEQVARFEAYSILRFVIADTGIGMDKSFIPKIFDSFTQEDSTRVNKFGSTGLGMAIAKNIIEMMNGNITVESEKGVGSTFTVVLSLRNSNRSYAYDEGDLDLNGLRILVVDDNEVAADHVGSVLKDVGITADVCLDGQTALGMLELQHAKREPYNLVLLDWKMPELDGVETAREIKSRFGDETTIIILTAYCWDDIKEEAEQAGIDSFLNKPLFASTIASELRRIAKKGNWSICKEKGRADLAGRRVLLAEDVMINAKIMMKLLSSHGIETELAENGRIALEKFRESEAGFYCAVLMDVRMPEMDGLTATAEIRALPREDARRIPIIAMTANAFDEDVQKSLQAGMNAHLSKPVEAEDLFRTLEELVWEAEA